MSRALGGVRARPSVGDAVRSGARMRSGGARRWAWILAPLIAVLVAAAASRSWFVTTTVVLAVLVGAAGLLSPGAFVRAFLWIAGVLLLGYVCFGRGFAYVGLAPVYVGDVVFAIGLVAALVGGLLGAIKHSRLCWILLAYMAWGALRTVPYLETFRTDALRDAVIWAYGGYGILVATGLLRTGWWRHVPAIYGACVPWVLLWLPVGILLTWVAADALPRFPGAQAPIIFLKAGDVAVHLAGVASFLLLRPGGPAHPGTRLRDGVCWVLWSCLCLVVASQNRAGMLAILTTLAVTFLFLRLRRWFLPAVVATSLVALLVASDFRLDTQRSRPISPRQLLENVTSVFSGSGGENLSGSRNWRLEWWREILDYTVRGEHFWGGKGFGINLASDDGYQVGDGWTLRSPHNGHLTILARSGVPAFCFWLSLQGLLAVTWARTAIRARRRGDRQWFAFNAWLLAYWSAFMVNIGFDVFLEGPQGGIWFWCLVGLGITLAEIERRRSRLAAVPTPLGRPLEHESAARARGRR